MVGISEDRPSPEGRGGGNCPECGRKCRDHSTLLKHRRKIHDYKPPGEKRMEDFGMKMPELEYPEKKGGNETRQTQICDER